MSVDRAFFVMTDGLTKEDAYVALTRAREATELHAVAREPIERAEFAPEAEERAVSLRDLGVEAERTAEGTLAIDERVRSKLEGVPTRELVAELERASPSTERRAIERQLLSRRRAAVEIAIATKPDYVTEAIGRKPEGLRPRLEWERAVERLEALRQRLGVKDRDRALGPVPRDFESRRSWREAQRELERLRRSLERGAARERARGLGIER